MSEELRDRIHLDTALEPPPGPNPVAQICNLLYRRIAFGKGLKYSERAGESTRSRLKICDTAECNSALPGRRQDAPFTIPFNLFNSFNPFNQSP
jgi:hypothetical protein